MKMPRRSRNCFLVAFLNIAILRDLMIAAHCLQATLEAHPTAAINMQAGLAAGALSKLKMKNPMLTTKGRSFLGRFNPGESVDECQETPP